MTFWGVRAGKYGEGETFALDHGHVVVGWSDLDSLAAIRDREHLKQTLRGTYPSLGEGTISNWTGKLWSFAREIRPGDLVALPRKNTGTVAIGEVTGDYEFDPAAPEPVRHRRRVRWLDTALARNRLDQDILYSLGSVLTVFQVRRDGAELRVRALLSGRSVTAAPDAEAAEFETPDPRETARDLIRKRIGERFKGHRLAVLVAEILKAQGFLTETSDPGPDGGVDIFATKGFLGTGGSRVVVQVKSQDQPVDAPTVRQLQGSVGAFKADHGLIVAWGGFKPTVEREFRRDFFHLQFWSGDRLVDELLSIYDALPAEVRSDLPLERIWVLVPDRLLGKA